MTRLGKVWRSMPLRLAILLVSLFTVVSLLSLAASYAVTQASFEESIRASLRQDMAGFRAAPNAAAVATLIEAESREADPKRLILSYVAPSGRIFGNGAVARDEKGFHILSFDRERAEFEGKYLSLTESLYGGLVTVARSRADIVALGDVFVNILWISLLPTVLIALSGGMVLARRSKRHVEVVSQALDRMTNGDLAARVVVGPRWSDDLREIGGRLNQMAAAQETSVEALRQVSSDIAHDLRTPLQRVALYLDDLESKTAAQPDETALVTKAQAEVAQMSDVFRALLQLAQMEAGSARERFEDVDLGSICETIVDMFEPTAAGSDQVLRFCREGDAAPVFGDPSLLGQLVSNLVENALTHSGEGSHIIVSLIGAQGKTTLQVVDDGPGVPAQERDKVLQRLYRLDRSRLTPGNGLGLSLVDAVAKLHRAEITLEDAAPGLRVSVTFSARPVSG